MRAYYVYVKACDEHGVMVISDNCVEAKKIALDGAPDEFEECRVSEIKVSWCKGADVSGLKKGIYEKWIEALKRGLCPHGVINEECPKCKAQETTVFYEKETGFSCLRCRDEKSEAKP